MGVPFIVIWVATFMGTFGIGVVSPLLPVFAKEMGAGGIWLGLAFSGFAFTQTPLMPVVGRLSDRFGKKLFIVGGLFIYVVTAAGYAWSSNFESLILFRLLGGVGAAMMFPTAFAYVGELCPPGHEGRYMGLFNIATMVGWGTGPVLGGVLSDAFGMDATFAAMGVMSAAASVVAAVLLPQRPAPASSGGKSEPQTPYFSIMRNDAMRGLVALQLVWGLSYGAVFSFLAVFMTSKMGLAATAVGVVMATRAILNGLLVYPFGWLADRASRVALVTVGVIAAAIGTFFIPWVGSLGLLLALFAIIGLFESVAMPGTNAIAVERGRHFGMGSVMGVFNMGMSLGMITGSVIGGLIEELTSIDYVFRYATVMGLLGALAFNFFMWRASHIRPPVTAR